MKTKLIVSDVPQKHEILAHSYGFTSTEAAPPAPSLAWKGRVAADLLLLQVNTGESAELARLPDTLLTWRGPSFACEPPALLGERRI